jgi:hypothetical protein
MTAAGQALVVNGGFEAALAPWMPNDFAFEDGADCTTAFSGNCALLLHGRRAGAGRSEEGYLWARQSIAGQLAGTFTFTASSKASGARRGRRARYRAQARFRLQGGGARVRDLDFSRGTHDWETLATAPIAMPSTPRISVELDYFDQDGQAWFDGIGLVRVP